jgi:hypothetical protein
MGAGDFNGNGLNGVAIVDSTMTSADPNGGIDLLAATCSP